MGFPHKGSVGIAFGMGSRTLWPSPSAACMALAYEVDRGHLMGFRARVARTRDRQYPPCSPDPFHCPDGMRNRLLHISCNFTIFLILLSCEVEGRPQFYFHLRKIS